MITLKGSLLNIIPKSEYKKEGETLATPVKAKVQILVENTRANGIKVKELHTISIPDSKIAMYQDKVNKDVEVPVGIISKQFSFYGV